MDINLTIATAGLSQPYAPPQAKAQSNPPAGDNSQAGAAQAAPAAPASVPAPHETAASSDAAQEAAVRQAALSFKDVYPLGDQEFTIFKDSSGKYITRYTSLRDGSVTYIPEPTLLKQIQIGGGSSGPSRIAIHV